MIHGRMQVFNLFFVLFVFLCFLLYEKAQFSKESIYRVSQSWLSMTDYNFCWDHRSLRIGTKDMKMLRPYFSTYFISYQTESNQSIWIRRFFHCLQHKYLINCLCLSKLIWHNSMNERIIL